MKRITRSLCIALVLILCLPVFSAGAFADEEPAELFPQEPAAALETAAAEGSVPDDADPSAVDTDEPEPDMDDSEPETDPAEEDLPVISDAEPEPEEELWAEGQEATNAWSAPEGSDSDELFAAYVETQFYGAPVSEELPALDGVSTGSRLSGKDAKAYAVLKPFLQKIAAGEIKESRITLSLADLGLPTVWSAADLGVSSISAELDTAKSNFSKAFSFDAAKVMAALLADMPYDLYWYDKTVGYMTATSYKFSYNAASATFDASMDIYFAVSKNYLASSYKTYSAGGKTYPITLNSTPSRVTTAVNNAKSIVASNASKSDYLKLKAYKEAVCSNVSYNNTANAGGVSYGDPWQLIYVFDGDSSTKVVCEGYSKAFQYLCDISEFKSSRIVCYSVTGNMTGGKGAGAHMWNIVHMDDGKNYLVDTTNCDAGTVGYPEYLFLKGYTSGSVGSQYTFKCGTNGTITFTYDSTTRALFTQDELTLSGSAYDPANAQPDPVQGDVNGDGTANALDAALILRSLVGRNAVTGYTAADAAAILKTK